MKVLLIWHNANCDQNFVQYFLLENLNEEEIQILKKVSNNFGGISGINADIEKNIMIVGEAICDKKEYCKTDWACKWANNKIELPLTDIKLDYIIQTGWVY